MGEGQIKFLVFYLTFFLSIAFFGAMVPDIGIGASADVSAVPALDQSNLTLLSYLLFVFEIVIYFLGLQGLAVVGIPVAVAALIGVVLDTVLVYIIVRLVRGGG